jgi:hypothetical protein
MSKRYIRLFFLTYHNFDSPGLDSGPKKEREKTWLSRLNNFSPSLISPLSPLRCYPATFPSALSLSHFHSSSSVFLPSRIAVISVEGDPLSKIMSSLSFLALITELGARNSVGALFFSSSLPPSIAMDPCDRSCGC